MEKKKTIVLVLRSGGDFSMRDVELIVWHILNKWKSTLKPRIICLWDKASSSYDLGNFEIIPLNNRFQGTWSRIMLYSPDMDQYRPFLYVDLDTAIINSLENIFDLVKNEDQFITLEDFWQKNQLATGLVWFPANTNKIKKVWEASLMHHMNGIRMDTFLRIHITPDCFWQNITDTIHDFKPARGRLLENIPEKTNIICFHGKPRIFEAQHIKWVRDYVNATNDNTNKSYDVTIIIPYDKDRGFLQKAVDSVPKGVQLLISQGPKNWPTNFNKVLSQAKGRFIKWLHEDDMLTPNCIEDSIEAFDRLDVDFIHGNAYEIFEGADRNMRLYIPSITIPTVLDLLNKNIIHSATLMYRKEVFEKVGVMDESLNTMEEFEFNLRCLKAGLRIGYCNSPLAYYRRHPAQKVRVVPEFKKREERDRVKSKYL